MAVKRTLRDALQDYLTYLKVSGKSQGTLRYYMVKVPSLIEFLESRGVHTIDGITSQLVRDFIAELQKTHEPGGVHAIYRGIKAFIRFLFQEGMIDSNPMERVRYHVGEQVPLDPVPIEHISAILDTCGRSLVGLRDRVAIMILTDTGVRAQELLNLNIGDIDLSDGSIIVRRGKSCKPRVVFIGKKTRRVLLTYLRMREPYSSNDPLIVSFPSMERMSYYGLRIMVRRRAIEAGVKPPVIHGFRRTFALTMLRNGVDVLTLSRLMGHGSLPILLRYIKLEKGDLIEAHESGSPVDRLL